MYQEKNHWISMNPQEPLHLPPQFYFFEEFLLWGPTTLQYTCCDSMAPKIMGKTKNSNEKLVMQKRKFKKKKKKALKYAIKVLECL